MCSGNNKKNSNEKIKDFVAVCKVLANSKIAQDVFKMRIGGEAAQKICGAAKAGQFINVYLKDKSTLLPRPISICNLEKEGIDIVFKVVGKGTKALSEYLEGEEIRISSALGNGYATDSCEKSGSDVSNSAVAWKAVLVGGGVGVPPMLELAKQLSAKGVFVTAVLGFQEEPFLVEEMSTYSESLYITTDNGQNGYHGTTVDFLKENNITADEFFACGPKPMLKALTEYCTSINIPVQVSLEERMGCGYGACVGCTCKVTEGEKMVQKAVCKDGPVFKGSEVVWNE